MITRSVWRCLYLQRLCPLPGFSYFAVFGTFLGINLWAVVCRVQPNNSTQGVRYKNVVTNCQIISTWDHQKCVALSRGGGANFECCVFKRQPMNSTRYIFKVSKVKLLILQ